MRRSPTLRAPGSIQSSEGVMLRALQQQSKWNLGKGRSALG